MAEQERERLLSELQRSNKELEQFAYIASHDLQEPLRTVASYVQLLDRKYKGRLDDKADKYIYFAVDGVERMQKLIEGLLAYSRISRSGEEFKPVDLNKVFSAAVSNLSVSIRESHADIGKDDLPVVPGDATQLVQLFQNLIGNCHQVQKTRPTAAGARISQERRKRVYLFRPGQRHRDRSERLRQGVPDISSAAYPQ